MAWLRSLLLVVALCWLLQSSCVGLPLPLGRNYGAASSKDELLCNLCIDTMKYVQQAVESNATLQDLYPYVEPVCELVLPTHWGFRGSYMCPGLINSYGPAFLYVVAHIALPPKYICEVLHLCKGNSSIANGRGNSLLLNLHRTLGELKERKTALYDQYSLAKFQRIDQQKNSIKQRVTLQNGRESVRSNRRLSYSSNTTLTILQLSDIHFDRFYAEGSPTDCQLYVCCRSWYSGNGSAGRYGSFACDLPLATLELLVETLSKLNPQPDIVLYTGDNPPHDLWNETVSSQLSATKFLVDYLAERLPHLSIYPAIGNHETWPESEYLATLPVYQFMTEHLAQYWQEWAWFPQEALQTIAEGGFYSVELTEGLRLIAFNSNYGYNFNFYSFLNDQNPAYQRQQDWMVDQLSQAEKNGEKVVVIAHIPPGDDDNSAEYGEFYLNLTRRFSKTIVGHFFGHTHHDQFQLVQDGNGVYGVALVAPSVTPYGHMNPSFRLFTMDRSSKQLLHYQQYHLNLTKANELAAQGLKPEFELSYVSNEEYGLQDLSPLSWAGLVERFEIDSSLLDKYYYNKYGGSIPSDKTCDALCKTETLCEVRNIISSEFVKCLGGQ